MKYKLTSLPSPALGVDYSKEESVVVPDQSLSLQDILQRFTRGEALPVGHSTSYGSEDLDNPLNQDLEKMANADLTEKAEFADTLKGVQAMYETQEKRKKASADKAQKAAKMAEEEARIEAEIKKRSQKPGSA